MYIDYRMKLNERYEFQKANHQTKIGLHFTGEWILLFKYLKQLKVCVMCGWPKLSS